MKQKTAEILAELKRQYLLLPDLLPDSVKISEKTLSDIHEEKERSKKIERKKRVLEKLENIQKALCRLERLIGEIETIPASADLGYGAAKQKESSSVLGHP